MGDHSHHHHHSMDHSHHKMEDTSTTTESLLGTIPSTTAATILQAVMTTMMSHDAHHLHRSPVESQPALHSFQSDQMASDSSVSDIHATHLNSGESHMPMYFHFGVDTVILFKEWTTSSTESIIGSVIGILILAMIYEGIKFFREFLFKKYFTSLEYSSVSVLGDDGKPTTEVHKVVRNRMLSWPHMIQTFLHVVQMILSYFLMLIFMTFNVWLCLGVVLGSGIGYFLFGWRKATVVDITEHCH